MATPGFVGRIFVLFVSVLVHCLPFTFYIICLFVVSVDFHFGFKGKILVLPVLVPGHCLLPGKLKW